MGVKLVSVRWMLIDRDLALRPLARLLGQRNVSKLSEYICGSTSPTLVTLARILCELNQIEPLTDQEKLDLVNDLLNQNGDE